MGGAQRVELMRAGHGTLAQAEEAIRELFSVIRKNGAYAHPLPGRALRSNGPRGGAGTLQVAQEATGIRCRSGFEDAYEDPTRRTVDSHKQIATGRFVSHSLPGR